MKLKQIKSIFAALALTLTLTGCIGGMRIKGGSVTSRAGSGAVVTQTQSNDPKDRSTLITTSERDFKVTLPPGSVLRLEAPVNSTNIPASVIVGSNSVVMESHTRDVTQSGLAGAQRNLAQEIGAKLESLQWVSYFGAAVFLFGLASAFWLPLKAVVGSITTSAVIALGGLVLCFAPVIVVGHELLIAGVTVAGISGYWFITHHAKVSATLKTVLGTNPLVNNATPAPTTTEETK
jgi:hypothetical protein